MSKHVRFGGLLKVEMLKKNASHGGGKHIWKSKCTKHTSSGPLLDVVKSKKCTPFGSENVQNTWCSDPFFDEWIAIRCRKSARRCGAKHIWKPNVSKTEGFEPLLIDVSDVVLFTDRQT